MAEESHRRGRVSEAAAKKATGQGWADWFALLDTWGAKDKGHKATAAHLADAHGVSPWWSQQITVEYERARGLRAVGQAADGFQVGVHRTIPVSRAEAWKRLTDPTAVARWLGVTADLRLVDGHATELDDGTRVEVRRADPPSFLRLRLENPAWPRHRFLQARVQPRKTGHAVSFHEEGLPDAPTREARRRHWKHALEALATSD